ncbi:MAG: flagellar biosynthesis protein FlhF [Alteromonadaceae bacterium]|nr:flagellar biosynthesis protein FlhF [Alteromonadaceae bacterium]
MKIRRFVAKDMRTALTNIKEELGADAVIMSNKKIPEGVELMAAVDYHQSVPAAQSNSQNGEQISTNQPARSEYLNSSADRQVPSQPNQPNQLKNDVVSLGNYRNNGTGSAANAVSPDQNKSTTVNSLNSNSLNSSTSDSPSDSLAALLGRQIQQPTPNDTVATNELNSADSNIEQKLKNFTDRLKNSTSTQHSTEQQTAPFESGFGEQSISESYQNMQTEQAQQSQYQANNQISNQRGNSEEFANMQKEMASIRQLLEHQMSGLMWQDMARKSPSRAVLVNRLMAMGITEELSDQIAGYIPPHVNEQDAWQQAQELIIQQINTTNNDIIQCGGVVSLVGPTGVGKTTTIAKLAARFAQINGADQVVLISTDSYRIAGFEQLATYGKIIGCQVKLAPDAETLDDLLQKYSNKKLILIDTAGMGQRDMRLAEHLTTLIANARVRIRNYLVLAANTQQRVMQENVERFKKVPLVGCIYTKLDESLSIGEIVSTSIQNGLPIGYLTDGQRVPEDIKVANAEKLVRLADKMSTKYAKTNSVSWRPLPTTAA